MSFLARLFDGSDTPRLVRPGELSRAFRQASHFGCPNPGCAATMVEVARADAISGDTSRSRAAHFAALPSQPHEPACPERGGRRAASPLETLCDAIDGSVPVLVNLDFETGFDRNDRASDLSDPYSGQNPTCQTSAQWLRDMRANQGERPHLYHTVAAHGVGAVMRTIDSVTQYRDGAGLERMYVQHNGVVQSLQHFALYDDAARMSRLIGDMLRQPIAGQETVKAAPKLITFRPHTQQRAKKTPRSIGSVRGISVTGPGLHPVELHVRPGQGIALRAFAERQTVTQMVVRPYMFAREAYDLRAAIASGRAMMYPPRLYLRVIDVSQYNVSHDRRQGSFDFRPAPIPDARVSALGVRYFVSRRPPALG